MGYDYFTAALRWGLGRAGRRHIPFDHSSLAPEMRPRVPEAARYAQPVHSSWRMDETAVSVRVGGRYLYPAPLITRLNCRFPALHGRSESSARAFFTRALKTHQKRCPEKVRAPLTTGAGDVIGCTTLCLASRMCTTPMPEERLDRTREVPDFPDCHRRC